MSAFLKIAEHSDYAFLFESVEGGEQVARYSFLGKDPFLVLRSRGGRTVIDRSGVTTETSEAFIPVLRRMMAEFRAPFVPGLPRFTGGAVGFIGYDASVGFEPALADAWQKARWNDSGTPPEQDEAGFMGVPVIKAIPVRDRSAIAAAMSYPDEVTVLLDAHDPIRRGGTGLAIDWSVAAEISRERPVILSGGLNADNVARAVDLVRPYAVDVSSGVESAPGRKDAAKLQALFESLGIYHLAFLAFGIWHLALTWR